MTNLPIPIPAQEIPGNLVTGALWNANVFNGLTYMLNPPIFVGYQNTSQSIGQTVWTPISIDTTTVDSYGGHSNTTNNSRYTAQVAGWYTVCGVYGTGTGSSTGFRAARIQVNGSPIVAGAVYMLANGSVETGVVTPTKDVYLNAGDYVEVAAWQNSGASLGTTLDVDIRCGLWVRWSHV
jgi:hypothetical protein